ncbi:hypothetical protein GH714_017959 [Hevea brasiliensis]|uniref:ABC transporter domain-containing protein n=1 Tax=Hevea brasiliensis TaxID=3981 RepID=A0A6A6KPR8_HEVBR|nr:hypothetical protein GH714_017959 [Hevea brasiliensis]
MVQERIILNGITGMVSPGEILAILGPSGSGKSTLLNALAGRLQGRGFTGTVVANNKKLSKQTSKRTGFVTQDDILSYLTVRETLIFCSLLRLPKSLSKKEKTSVAESVISELGLKKCENTIIGNTFIRGSPVGKERDRRLANGAHSPHDFLAMAYWMAGLKPELVAFLLTLLVLLGYVLVSQGLGLALGAAIMDAKQASTIVTVTMLAFVLTGGFYVHKRNLLREFMADVNSAFREVSDLANIMLINCNSGHGRGALTEEMLESALSRMLEGRYVSETISDSFGTDYLETEIIKLLHQPVDIASCILHSQPVD